MIAAGQSVACRIDPGIDVNLRNWIVIIVVGNYNRSLPPLKLNACPTYPAAKVALPCSTPLLSSSTSMASPSAFHQLIILTRSRNTGGTFPGTAGMVDVKDLRWAQRAIEDLNLVNDPAKEITRRSTPGANLK